MMEVATMAITSVACLLLGACSTWAVMTEEVRHLRALLKRERAAKDRVAQRLDEARFGTRPAPISPSLDATEKEAA